MNPPDDLSRLRVEYADRERRFAGSDVYSPFNRANLFAVQGRQRAILDALRRQGVTNLRQARILEMGCGDGGVLAEFLTFGASPQNLFGIDLLPDRLREARYRLPSSPLVNADGSHLPFPDSSFDLILQFTALSSILEADLRRAICHDMLRLLEPNGLILSYDFWLNPTNPQTRGLRPKEIKELFPSCRIVFQRITLAPPIARRLVPFSRGMCYLLESLKIFNTHYLAAIHPPK
ncbi:MAG: class I SAM-dependent methyltransferase [Chloroflexota bacterium]